MATMFFTNDSGNNLFEKFKAITDNDSSIECLDALVGYFRSSGYFALRPYLEKLSLRVIVGINVDHLTADWHDRSLKGQDRVKEQFIHELHSDIEKAGYRPEIEDGIKQFVADVVDKRIQLRAYPDRNLHAKFYIFKPKDWNENKSAHVITGSSNFTEPGLGIGKDAATNYELNVLLKQPDDVEFVSAEFERFWNQGVPVLPKDVEGLVRRTFLKQDLEAIHLFYKFLWEIFGNQVDFDPASISENLPSGYVSLQYQIDAVNEGLSMLEKHNGFFLADVVGLGKTVVGAMLVKHYAVAFGREVRILIVVPPTIESVWKKTLKDFRIGEQRYDIVSLGSLHTIKDHSQYHLVIVDEAHRFRNSTTIMYDQLQSICKSPSPLALRKQVVLISATPLNNTPEDLANLLFLFQDSKNSTLEVIDLERYFREKQKIFQDAKKLENADEARSAVKELYDDIRTRVLSEVLIRRTRSDLLGNEEYKEDLVKQNVKFPKIKDPEPLEYELQDFLDDLYDRTLQVVMSELSYNRYRAIGFLTGDKADIYTAAEVTANKLTKLSVMGLLKRLDSSFMAFKKTLGRFRDANQAMITMWENDRIILAPNVDVTAFILEGKEEDLFIELDRLKDTDPSILICSRKDFKDGFIEGLRADKKLLDELATGWERIDYDPKWDKFVGEIGRLLSRSQNPEGKIVVFSESKDTTDYLAERFEEIARKGLSVLAVHADNRGDLEETIKANFDANYPEELKRNDFNVLVTTEVLAEGVNLHRANTIVNYDTPWNSTRLMQRIGRINRVGSRAEYIYIVNFLPASKVNDVIQLKKKAQLKIQAFHSALGEDSKIYTKDEEIEQFGLFSLAVEEGAPDERIKLLMELRRLRREDKELYTRISTLPAKVRCAVKGPSRETLVYFKTSKRDVFYSVRDEAREISFLEMARKLKTLSVGESFPVSRRFLDDVKLAESAYRRELEAALVAKKVADYKPSPRENAVLVYLSDFLDDGLFPELNLLEQEKQVLRSLAAAIRKGMLGKLVSEVHKVYQASKKSGVNPRPQLAKIFAIAARYNLSQDDRQEPERTVEDILAAQEAPVFVLGVEVQ